MELKQYYDRVMNESVNMALATSVGDKPNVRVVTFGTDDNQKGKLYFSTFKGCEKIKEFAANPRVTCMPLPLGPEAGAQVRIFGRVQRSSLTLQRLIDMIGKKAPDDADTLKDGGDMLEIYEVLFTEAWVTVGMGQAQKYVIGV